MSDNSKIEWTEASWNPILGCDRVSSGCAQCYAIRTVNRLAANPNPKVGRTAAGRLLDGREWNEMPEVRR